MVGTVVFSIVIFAFLLVSPMIQLVSSEIVRIQSQYEEHWKHFKTVYGKQYDYGEDKVRRMIWEQNMNMIRIHNIEASMGQYSFYLGMNKFGDMTRQERLEYLIGVNLPRLNVSSSVHSETSGVTYLSPMNVRNFPVIVDWTKDGYVTPVKDQKNCFSAWAFSAIGSLEGQHKRKTGQLVSLSEQNLIDCSQKQGNFGCNGGLKNAAFEYVKDNKGIDTEASYPYTGEVGTCRFRRINVGAICTGYVNIPKANETALKIAVATVGPISATIDASNEKFMFYKKGVYHDNECEQYYLNHGVLVVGYGREGNKDYWLVKNSWGTSWGMEGYITMSRNRRNMCGIATRASYPLV